MAIDGTNARSGVGTMKSIGFGLERIALLAVARPWLAAMLLALLFGVAGYGLTKVSFDDDLRNVFGGSTTEFATYTEATRQFVDPENQLIVLVEATSLAGADIFSHLREFQFELQFVEGVADVFSLFALRYPPDEAGNAPLVIDDMVASLTPDRIAQIRQHPLLGGKLLSADATAMMYVVTPEEAAAPLDVSRRIESDIETIAEELLAGTGAIVTVTGFPVIRISIVDILIRDQIVLNTIGAVIGFVMSLIVFGSLTASIMIAVPAILSALVVAGGLGAFGIPITVMTNVVPVLVMILGYANSMHLCRDWRLDRDTGSTPANAARHSILTVGPACILAALTTSVAFLSLTISDVQIVSDFGWIGAIGCLAGALVVLMLHGLMAVTIGRFWQSGDRTATTVITWLGGPSAAIGRFAADHARALNIVAFTLVVVFGAMYAAVRPEYSTRENLSQANPANAALGRIDEQLGGSYPVHIIVPLGDSAPTTPEAIAKIGAVHRAVAAIDGVETPLSLWSLVEWLGSDTDTTNDGNLKKIVDELAPATRQRFYGTNGGALVSASIREAPTAETEALIERIETAARGAAGDDIIVTGVTVVTTREATRTISNLNLSLIGAVFSGLLVILIAFRNWRIALTSIVPNVLPLLGTGALLYGLGRGMQFNGVLALTVAFGIAVDGTIHYFNYFFQFGDDSKPLRENLIETTRRIGPQLFGTTAVIVTGLATTQTSEMPTIALFGILAAATLSIGLVGDLIILPALMAGAARQWFTRQTNSQLPARDAA